VRLADFQTLVDHLLKDVPAPYLNGVVAVEVSPKTVPHPVRADIYTLGECIPLEWSGDGSDLQSRVVLYHGSFQALARLGELDWREEAWETLTHELRHHLEWRAKVAALERYDWAAEQNFARHEGEPFDPAFYRSGEQIAPGIYKVDDDVFLEAGAGSGERSRPPILWHGKRYRVTPPRDLKPPAFLALDGLAEPPPGEAVLVLPRRTSLFGFWRRPSVTQTVVAVEPLDG
jgi:zinicin-like metallopeptidase